MYIYWHPISNSYRPNTVQRPNNTAHTTTAQATNEAERQEKPGSVHWRKDTERTQSWPSLTRTAETTYAFALGLQRPQGDIAPHTRFFMLRRAIARDTGFFRLPPAANLHAAHTRPSS